MATTSDLQTAALNLQARLKAKKERLDAQYKQQVDELERQIQAVTTTLRLLHEPDACENSIGGSAVSVRELERKTAREALKIIARAAGGRVKITEAKPLLIQARILRKTKNTWGVIDTTLKRSPEFEKVPNEPATYRLKETYTRSQLPIQ